MATGTCGPGTTNRPAEAALRVLVVDDEYSIRRLIVELLRDEGYEVREADDGERALEKLGRWNADAILLDLSMPRMDGLTFLQEREARGIAADVPVIILSASRQIEAIGEQASAVIVKPFDLERFLAVLNDVLAPSRR